MPNVLLCIPPDYDHNYPPLGTPALAAFLKQHGLGVAQQDLNLGYRRFLCGHMSHSGLTDAQKIIILPLLLKKFYLKNLRGRYYSQYLKRTHESRLPLLPYDNNTNSSFAFTERLLSSPHLRRYLGDEKENTFLQFYRATAIPDLIRKEKAALLGLSVVSPSQAIAGLTLGLLVKKALPNIHVVFGGPWVTLYRHELLRRKKVFFKCFDSFVVFEGEIPLLSLARALTRKDNAPILQVIRSDSAPEELDRFENEDLNKFPCPDFDGLPLEEYDEYNSFGAALTYETSRGCYWSKCAYCVDLPLPKPVYRAKDASRVAADIRQLREKYKARVLMLGDPGVSPRQMRDVSEAILKSGVKIGWWCMARLDEGFRPALFGTARRAGLRQINFGFESASDRVCDLLDKGNRRERSSRIIRDAHAAGISVDLQTMIALPGETWEEGLKTVEFLLAHKAAVSHVSFNVFYLTPANHIFGNPEKYGLEVDKKKVLPFGFFLPFKNKNGLSTKEGHLLQKLYYSLLEKKESAVPPFVRDADKALILEDDVTQEKVTLCLNSETSTGYFLHKRKTSDLFIYDSAHRGILAQIKKGVLVKDIRNKCVRGVGDDADPCVSFIAEALEKGFLKYERV